MIVDFFFGFLVDLVLFVLDLLPVASPQLVNGIEVATLQLSTVIRTIEPYEVVIPFSTFFQAAGIAIGAMVTQIGVRVVRIIASFLTLGGGQ